MASMIVTFTIYSTAILLLGLHVHYSIIDARMKREHKEIVRDREAREWIRIKQVRDMFDRNTI